MVGRRGWLRNALALTLLGVVLTSCGSSGEPVAEQTFSPPAAASAAVTAVVLGDSYTVGLGSTGDGYVGALAEQMGWSAVNAGESGTGYVNPGQGEDTAPYADRLTALIAQHPDVVLVQGSTNDVGYPVDEVRQAALAAFERLRTELPDAEVVVVGPADPPGVDAVGATAVRDAVSSAADQAGVGFVDPIAQSWLPPSDAGLFSDTVHPDDAGYQLFADRLAAALTAVGL